MKKSESISEVLKPTSLQKGLLFHAYAVDKEQSDPYIIHLWGILEGPIDQLMIEKAWKILIDRHVTLRSAFVVKSQAEARHIILNQIPFSIHYENWTSVDTSRHQALLNEIRTNDRKTAFDPAKPPLFRFYLAKVSDKKWMFLLSHHHLILDGWSQSILLKELTSILNALIQDIDIQLNRAVGPHFTQHQNEKTLDVEFWKMLLDNWQPIDIARLQSIIKSEINEATRITHKLSSGITKSIVNFSQNNGITPNAIANLAWGCTLAKWFGTNDLCFGLTLAGRNSSSEALNAVGMFVNTLPFRIKLNNSKLIIDVLQEIHNITVEINSRDLDDLQEIQKIAGANQSRPLFSSLLAFENYPADQNSDSLFKFSNIHSDERTNLPLALVIIPGDNWSVSLQIDTRSIDARLAELMALDFLEFCRLIPLNRSKKLGAIQDASLENDGVNPYLIPPLHNHEFKNLVTYWKNTVNANASNIALTYLNRHYSYLDLEEQSNLVANGLRSQGIKIGDRVVISLERSPEYLISILGILKNGATYVPLDTSNPLERLVYIINDAKPALIISENPIGSYPTHTFSKILSEGRKTTQFDSPSFIGLPAYIIYTSGSTGKPKGVEVTHRNVLSLFSACNQIFNFTSDDSWTIFHSFAFDFSVWEIWGPWLTGGRCVLIPQDVIGDNSAFVNICKNEEITVLSQTPSAFNIFMEAEKKSDQKLNHLRHIIFGGEALHLKALDSWFERYPDTAPVINNMYGITETTVHTTWRKITRKDLLEKSGSLIGAPLEHLSIKLFNANELSTPKEISGEIYVGGTGVANGYLNQPRLTAEKFIPNSNSSIPGDRVYVSGDSAKRVSRTEFEYIGRIDNQIKIRGYRIEIGEIEVALSKISNIRQAKVGVWEKRGVEGNAKELGICAWIKSDTAIDPTTLRSELSLKIPYYMLPDIYIPVNDFPLNINGKIDTKLLPNPYTFLLSNKNSSDSEYLSEDERKMCKVWAEALKVPNVAPTDNYFSIGGDSIQSIRVVALATKIGLEFPIRQIFQNPSPRQLTSWIKENASQIVPKTNAYQPFSTLPDGDNKFALEGYEDAWPISKMQAGMLFHSNYGDQKNLYIDSCNFWLEIPIKPELLSSALKRIFTRHAVLRSFFRMDTSVPLQIVEHNVSPKLDLIDFRNLLNDEAIQKTKDDLKHFTSQTLQFEEAPLLKFKLYLISDQLSVFSFIVHHAILDGWSVANFSAEIFNTYQELEKNKILDKTSEINTQPILTKNENAFINDKSARDRWLKRLEILNKSNISHWPINDYLPAGKLRVPLNSSHALSLKKLAKESQIPIKYWIMGCLSYLLGLINSTNTASFGLVVNNRPTLENSEKSLGLFLNTIPIKIRSQGSWTEIAKNCLETEAEIYEDRLMPLAELVKMNGGVKPFILNFNYVNFRPVNGLLENAGIKERLSETVEFSDIPLTFNLSIDDSNDAIDINISHDGTWSKTQLFWIRDQFLLSIESAIKLPNQEAHSKEIIPNNAYVDDSIGAQFKSTLEHVLEMCNANVENTVLIDSSSSYSGQKLLSLTFSITEELKKFKINEGQPIAILMHRNAFNIASQIAIWCQGCWYVNLDISAPLERNLKILEELDNPLLLGTPITLSAFSNYIGKKLNVSSIDLYEFNLQALSKSIQLAKKRPSNLLAYAIYTSGSTGKPKGVQITHLSLSTHMNWMIQRFQFSPRDKILHRTKSVFDASIWEVWGPLMSGAQLVLLDESASNSPEKIANAIRKHNISIMQVVPSLLDVLLDRETISNIRELRILFVGGEVLRPELINELDPPTSLSIVNLYGPSETTIDASYEIIEYESKNKIQNSIPIGQAIYGTNLYIVDTNLNLVPTGSPGELLIGGKSPGLGYLKLPRLTAERFIPDPFKPNGIVFRSGDLVQRLPNNKIYYIHRIDRQVKIGGNRIELDEIESKIFQLFPKIRAAVEISLEQDTSKIFVFAEENKGHQLFKINELREKLGAFLPSYMLPHNLFWIKEWPLISSSGKTDRKALLKIAKESINLNQTNVSEFDFAEERSSHNSYESSLLKLASSLLGKRVMREEDFFSIGGDSIIAMQLVAKARKQSIFLNPKNIFEYRTIAQLANYLEKSSNSYSAKEVVEYSSYPLLPMQNWFLKQNFKNPNWWNQVVGLEILTPVNKDSIIRNLNAIGKRHRAFSARLQESNNISDGDPSPLIKIIQNQTDKKNRSSKSYIDELENIHKCISIKNGPIWGALLEVDSNNEVKKLFLVVHHFIIDGMSWRIIFEELTEFEEDHTENISTENIASISNALAKKIADAKLDPYWDIYINSYRNTVYDEIPYSEVSDSLSFNLTFNESDTDNFLYLIKHQWRMNLEQILTLICINAISHIHSNKSFAIGVERHGRDQYTTQGIDEIIGWFTAMYCFICPTNSDVRDSATLIKNQFNQINELNSDWLIASTIQPNLIIYKPQILINWLGNFDSSFSDHSYLAPLKIDVGNQIDPVNSRTSLLDVTGLIKNRSLNISISVDRNFIDSSQLDTLRENFLSAIKLISTENTSILKSNLNASNFPWIPMEKENIFNEISSSKRKVENIFLATPAQQGIYFTGSNQIANTGHYVQQIEFSIDGKLEPQNIINLFHTLLQSYQALRTSFFEDSEGSLFQLVEECNQIPYVIVDLKRIVNPDAYWEEFLIADRLKGFDLNQAPLSRIAIAELSETKWKVLWSHHHLVLDGWSLSLLISDLSTMLKGDHKTIIEADRTSFWIYLKNQISQNSIAQKYQFWQERFSSFNSPTLISNHLSKSFPKHSKKALQKNISIELSKQLVEFSKNNGLTLSTLIQGAWSVVLSRITGLNDISYGITVSGRPPELENSSEWVGMFINTLPLRVPLSLRQPLLEWLANIQVQVIELYSHYQDSLADVQSWSGFSGNLFDSIVVIENYPIDQHNLISNTNINIQSIKSIEENEYPLSLYVGLGDQISLTLRIEPSIISQDLAHGILDFIQEILSYWASKPDQVVGSFINHKFQNLDLKLDWCCGLSTNVNESVIQKIVDQSFINPTKIAIQDEGGISFTYEKMISAAQSLRHALENHGIKPGDNIAVMGEKSCFTVIGFLGCQLLGACFIPLDPDLPLARLEATLVDSNSKMIIFNSQSKNHPLLSLLPNLDIQNSIQNQLLFNNQKPLPETIHMHSLAYMMFTSGSTGRPKGVQISNTAFANALMSFAKVPGVFENDIFASVTTLSFDISLAELFTPLITGATCYLVSKDTARDGIALDRLISKIHPSIMQATPATWKLLRSVNSHHKQLQAWSGGEALSSELAKWLLENFKSISNFYGPTETTIWSTCKKIKSQDVNIGTPIDNTDIFLLDTLGLPVFPNCFGELLIGGLGLARGYANRPDLTSMAFTPHPIRHGDRIYHTGDQAFWNTNGEISIVGRIDRQLKIDGYRIELEEIEALLKKFPLINDAVVATKNINDSVMLFAWFTSKSNEAIDQTTLKTYLKSFLPHYMIPRNIYAIKEFPLTPNGKIDVNALQADDLNVKPIVTSSINPLEKTILMIWMNVLKKANLTIDDDFIGAGGHSLIATQIRAKLEKIFKIEIPITLIFNSRTIRELAREMTVNQVNGSNIMALAEQFIHLASKKDRLN